MKSRHLVALFVLGLSTLPVVARAQACGSSSGRAIAFSNSGGISRGSYQAGVTWALVEGLRRGDSLFEASSLVSVSGASAGNVNAAISAITWAMDPRDVRDETQSLFWKVWVNMGIDELRAQRGVYPANPGDGVLSRTAFAAMRDSIAEFAASARFRSCRIPVGVTLTRTVPMIVEGDGVSTTVVRTVALFEIDADSTGLRFIEPRASLRQDRRLGVTVVPSETGRAGVTPAAVYDVLEASGSFPVAWDPKEMSYWPVRVDGESKACADSVAIGHACRGRFIDGGVFDNNPLSVAHDLAKLDSSSEKGRLLDIYYTRVLPPDTTGRRVKPPRGGLGGFADLVPGLIAAGRDVELHGFLRRKNRDTRVYANDRTVPLYSGAFYAFAGFFGKPFREHDFYVGVADGIRVLAELIECPTEPSEPAQRKGRQETPAKNVLPETACANRTAASLAESDVLPLSATGRDLVRDIVRFQSSGTVVPTAMRDGADTSRARREHLLRALLYASTVDSLPRVRARVCAPNELRDSIDKALCEEDFAPRVQMLRALAGVQAVTLKCPNEYLWLSADAISAGGDFVRREGSLFNVGEQVRRLATRHCGPDADIDFNRLIRNTDWFVTEIVQRSLHQLWLVEQRDNGQKFGFTMSGLTEWGVNEFVLRARRPGFQLQPTSRPLSIYAGPRLRSKFVAAVGTVIPYRVTMADVGFGAQYRAAWRLTDRFYLGVPLEYQRARDATAIGEVNAFRTGVAAWYAIPNKLLPAFEAQLLTAAQDGGFAIQQSGGARVMLTLLGDKFSIGGRWTTRADRAYFELPTSYWEFTIGDLGGLAYWIAGR